VVESNKGVAATPAVEGIVPGMRKVEEQRPKVKNTNKIDDDLDAMLEDFEGGSLADLDELLNEAGIDSKPS
jgi:hypothetical protein